MLCLCFLVSCQHLKCILEHLKWKDVSFSCRVNIHCLGPLILILGLAFYSRCLVLSFLYIVMHNGHKKELVCLIDIEWWGGKERKEGKLPVHGIEFTYACTVDAACPMFYNLFWFCSLCVSF